MEMRYDTIKKETVSLGYCFFFIETNKTILVLFALFHWNYSAIFTSFSYFSLASFSAFANNAAALSGFVLLSLL